ITLTGDVVPVIEKVIFQPVAPPASDTASVPHAGFTANESDTTATPVRAVDQATEGEATMAFTEKHLQVLRSKFGLSATATEDEVLAALEAEEVEAEAAEPAAPAAEQTPAAPAAPAAEDAEDAEEDAEQAPETDAVEPTPAVKLSAANFAAMQEQNRTMAAQLQAITDERDKERRDGIVASAFRAGKLHKTEREAWRKALDENEAVTVSLLDARAAMFSTRERGSDVAPFSMDAGEALTEAQIAAENALFKIGGTK
ncbi:phage protease, partial [Arthrobacter sulfonylureivorans]|uniref:phage protease n=1 Tax=Arthrobacter sulfonylureivorans TaxID=2486855 RepID=UPI0039E5BC8C